MSKLVMTGMTDAGMVRESNEDCYLIVPEDGLAVLADGMGGHRAGEVASSLAVEQITRYLTDAFSVPRKSRRTSGSDRSYEARAMVEAIQLANTAIHEASKVRPEQAGMGTTIVVVAFHNNLVSVAHVGDSRLYRFRGGILTQITEDHSMIQELLRRGLVTPEEARTSLNKNLVTRALGVDPIVEVDVTELPFEDGDVYLVCSDGLNDVLSDDDIGQILLKNRDNLEDAVTQMVTEVNALGGPDNVSIILARTDGQFVRAKRR